MTKTITLASVVRDHPKARQRICNAFRAYDWRVIPNHSVLRLAIAVQLRIEFGHTDTQYNDYTDQQLMRWSVRHT